MNKKTERLTLWSRSREGAVDSMKDQSCSKAKPHKLTQIDNRTESVIVNENNVVEVCALILKNN